jgi:hypothetical protein
MTEAWPIREILVAQVFPRLIFPSSPYVPLTSATNLFTARHHFRQLSRITEIQPIYLP